MALDWKKAITPAATGTSAVKLSAAERTAKNMDTALAAFKGGNKDVARPTIKQVGEHIQFSVRFANTALNLVGTDSVFNAPTAQFEEIYAAIKESVLKGEFNAQLKPLEERVAERGKALSASKKGTAKAK